MSSSYHQQSRSKTSHKNRRKENDLQNLYRQNKSAFPEQMEERDILHTLEVNKVTQKNIGSFLGKLLNGELRLETAWSDVGSKKKKKEARPSVKDARRHGGNDRANRDDRGNRSRNRDKNSAKKFFPKKVLILIMATIKPQCLQGVYHPQVAVVAKKQKPILQVAH
jgi:hypothetical protein